MPPADAIRILVVEDNHADASLLKRLLQSVPDARFEIELAGRLSTALEMLASRSIELILLDLGLPDSSDLKTLVKVHAAAPGVPIIVITGNEDKERAREALANGAKDYLVKGNVDAHLLTRAVLRQIEAQ